MIPEPGSFERAARTAVSVSRYGSGPVPPVSLIWAQTPAGVIGAGGTMPWHVPEDLTHFQQLTRGHPVIMGRRTWESLPERFRPLPDRTNIVLTRRGMFSAPEGVHWCQGGQHGRALETAIRFAATCPGGERVWVIGGENIFRQALPYAVTIEITLIDLDVPGDTFAPTLDAQAWQRTRREPDRGWLTSTTGTRYAFSTCEKGRGRRAGRGRT